MTTTHKGVSIFYTDQGTGEALIFLHGFLENSSMWAPITSAFIDTHRVICIDLLGHGHTGCTAYIHTMEDMAVALKAVLDSLQVPVVTIVGHSMGGYVGCAFAKAYPEKLKALCLLNSTPLADDDERKLLRTRANKMAKENYPQLVRMSFMNLFNTSTRERYKTAIDFAIKEALQTPVQGYIAANSGMRLREDFSKLWHEGDFQKAIILGKDDWIINSSLHKSIFGSTSDYFKIIPGGHMSHIGQSTTVIKQLSVFINQI